MTKNQLEIQDEVIGGILLDKRFDVPDEVYDMVTSRCLVKLFLSGKKPMEWYLEEYLTNPNATEFFDFIRESVRPSYLFFDMGKTLLTEEQAMSNIIAYDQPLLIARLLLFNKKDWKSYWKDLHANHGWWISYLLTSACHPELDHQSIEILSILTDDYGEEYLLEKLKTYISIDDLVRLLYKCDVSKSYGKVMHCLQVNIPILYEHPDETDVWMYLKTVLLSGYRGDLDERIVPVLKSSAIGDTVNDFLYEIGTTLNQNNLKYFVQKTKTHVSMSDLIKCMNNRDIGKHGNHMSPDGYMSDFDTIISICGNNSSGISMDVQVLFLEQYGDITTMFTEGGKLKEEASIIKMTDQLPTLFAIITDDQLRFLLLNSSDFVKNILTSSWLTVKHYVRIAKALLVYPVDEELWRVINQPETKNQETMELTVENIDYRFLIINKIVTLLGTEVLFDNVPEALMYIEPSVLYITRNIKDSNIAFMPVDKIIPYALQHIGYNEEYRPLNLFCNGEYVSIANVLQDDFFLLKEIIRGKKYGYICDTKSPELKDLITGIVETIEMERG